MTTVTTDPRPRRWRTASVGGAVAMLVGLGVVLVVVLGQRPAPPAAPPGIDGATQPGVSTSVPGATLGDDTTDALSAPVEGADDATPSLAEATPTSISIPSIGVDSGFVGLGLTPESALEVPTDPADVGWFTGAHSPGAPGVAVIAGHVTWNGQPAVFFRLGELAAGDTVEIERADGTTAVFAVRDSATFPKDAFPTDEVYRASSDAELVLITCGGVYADAHYDSNVIVWADLVGARTV